MVPQHSEFLFRVSFHSLPYPRAIDCNSLSPLCTAHALALQIPLVAAIPSFDSANAPLFSLHSLVLWLHPVTLPYSSSDSDCLLSSCHPVNNLQGQKKPSQISIQGVLTSFDSIDTAELVCTSPCRCRRCCLRPYTESQHSELGSFRCSIIAEMGTATDASPAPSRAPAHDWQLKIVVSIYFLPDYHWLP